MLLFLIFEAVDLHFLLEYSLFLHDTILMLWYYSGVVNCIKSQGSQWEPRACPESDFTGEVNRRDKDFLDQDISSHNSQHNIFHFSPKNYKTAHIPIINTHRSSGSMSDQTISLFFMALQ